MDFARRLVPKAIRRRYAVKFGIALLILGLASGFIAIGRRYVLDPGAR